MARHFARVISVEPNEFNFALLTANVALNGLGNVQCIKAAMFSHETTLSLAPDEVQEVAIPRNMSGEPAWLECSNLGALVFSPGAGAVGARAQTLDSLGISDLAFLKIDAQGADGEVIAGGIETISRCRPVLVFEWEAELSRNFSVSFEHASKLLVEAGYEITVLKQHNEKQVDYLARSQAS
jgi:FkbM family methyltransferase